MSRRFRQPPARTPVDWGNPITEGLIRAITPTPGVYAFNAVNNRKYEITAGSFTSHVNEFGRAQRGSDSGGASNPAAYSSDDPAENYLNKQVSIVALVRIDNIGPSGLEKIVGESGTTGHTIYFGATPFIWQCNIQTNFTGPQMGTSSSSPEAEPVAGNYYFLCGTFDRNATTRGNFWVRNLTAGTEERVTSTDDIADDFEGITNLVFANHDSYDVMFYAIWNRIITKAEQDRLKENPWQIFKPQRSLILTNKDKPDLIKAEVPW